MSNPYPTPLDQAWLRFWVELYGADSKLARYLLPEIKAPHEHRPDAQLSRPVTPTDQTAPQRAREVRPAKVAKNKKLDREANRLHPLSDWARRLIGDERIAHTTLDDVLDGIGDYFEIFEQMRKMNRDAYAYFSRVGAPLVLRNSAIWHSQIYPRIPNGGASLPSFFGGFVPRTKDEYRDEILNNKSAFHEFSYFTKVKNPATVAPLGSTIFEQHQISLKRDCFSKQELKRVPWAAKDFGVSWYVGVLPDGTIRALPQRMQHHQRLPRGGVVHTSRFEIPPGLFEMSRDPDTHEFRTPHQHVSINFAVILAFTATAVSGINVTIRKGKKAARIGIPIAAAKSFFADRDLVPGATRRRPIIHLRLAHDRYLADGRIVTVGDYLAGERQFEWRGYQINIGAPGIHYPSPEGFTDGLWEMDEPGIPDEKMVRIGTAAKQLQPFIWRNRKSRFRKGKPTVTFADNPLDGADEWGRGHG